MSVLEVGSLDINGSIRPLFASAEHYHGIDIVAGTGVDEVADAATWTPPRRYDAVVCAEVLEHAPRWRDVVETMWSALAPGGTLLMTCAAPPRAVHSAVDGLGLRPGEHYGNITPADLEPVLAHWQPAWSLLEWSAGRGDLYVAARASG
jgi:hypothetical protein